MCGKEGITVDTLSVWEGGTRGGYAKEGIEVDTDVL